CKCQECKEDQITKGCANPHKCADEPHSSSVLDFLAEKWDPRRPDRTEDMGLSAEEQEQNLEARKENGVIRFDSSMDNSDTLSDGVKIFTSG
ncbi:hypothetical protein IW262DRAFT_1281213, partial [Armillaria fumosa]